MLKKISYVIFAILLLIPCLFVPKDIVYAQTLGDLKKELDKYEADYKANKNKQKLTKQEIEQTKQNILNANKEIDQIGKDIINLSEEIENLNVMIENKNVEIKEVMNYVQVSSGESAYLEYAFGAADFTDFIYRMAVSEQLTNYNEELINKYNQAIVDNNNKTKELADRQTYLGKKQNELASNLEKLSTSSEKLEDESVSIESEIASRKASINYYEKQLGCKDTDNIATCGTKNLPFDTAFWRPLVSGTVTADWGLYSPFGKETFHSAMDFATVDNNTPVYAAAAGEVADVTYADCGKNIVYIRHNINGKKYTTTYWHLRSVNVKMGQIVTKDTKIGIMGGAERDKDCSTGAHVHFAIATGLYLIDYRQQSEFNARRFDPREVLNAPRKGVYFANRTTKY